MQTAEFKPYPAAPPIQTHSTETLSAVRVVIADMNAMIAEYNRLCCEIAQLTLEARELQTATSQQERDRAGVVAFVVEEYTREAKGLESGLEAKNRRRQELLGTCFYPDTSTLFWGR